MPKIKALKFSPTRYQKDDKLLPYNPAYVNRGGVVVDAYMCPWTGKLFIQRQRYITHLKAYRLQRMQYPVRAQKHNTLKEQIKLVGSFDELIQLLNSNTKIIESISGGYVTNLVITKLDVGYISNASNTHGCPRSGVRNWIVDKKLPTSYPAWVGNIEFTYVENYHNYVSNHFSPSTVFEMLGIQLGSGGGSRTKSHYSVTLWEDDFPNMKANRHDEMVISVLQHGAEPAPYPYRRLPIDTFTYTGSTT